MPQLMPFMWIMSVFMSFLLLMVLVIIYSFFEKLCLFKLSSGWGMDFYIKW